MNSKYIAILSLSLFGILGTQAKNLSFGKVSASSLQSEKSNLKGGFETT
jgi:hypothetical protein